MNYIFKIFLFAILCVTGSWTNVDLSAIEILQRAERNAKSSTVITELTVSIKRPKWDKTMVLKTWTKGTEYAMAYVIQPDRDKGTVYLKANNEVWNYLPKIRKTVKLPAMVLAQNWMGTDMSTDDLMKLTSLTTDYKATVTGKSEVSGRTCYVIKLDPTDEAEVLWGRIEVNIDEKDFMNLKTVLYDEDLEVVNTITGSEIKTMGGKVQPSKWVVVPEGKSGHSTTIMHNSVTYNSPLSVSFFDKANMSTVRP